MSVLRASIELVASAAPEPAAPCMASLSAGCDSWMDHLREFRPDVLVSDIGL